ncbi:hypothetical protein MUK42_34040, partial [Musa troglodytarum]
KLPPPRLRSKALSFRSPIAGSETLTTSPSPSAAVVGILPEFIPLPCGVELNWSALRFSADLSFGSFSDPLSISCLASFW